MQTTAIYENRIKNRKELLSLIPLIEFGDSDTIFTSKVGTFLCKGYNRIVFGDHGPYIEFLFDNVLIENWVTKRSGIGYYDRLYPIDSTSILLYYQKKTVTNLPNPPKGKRSFNGNRKEGYADYRVGKYYISPYEKQLKIIKDNIQINSNENILKEILQGAAER